ncbi:MAG: heat-inducible transcriptional repressor HrcA [Gammaproteobacteria bacterium]
MSETTTTSTSAQLNDRALQLLRTLVQHHIAGGDPVGSRTLSRESGLSLSPATIRNVMADLEDLGLVRSPHTSAGRVPTALGYRVFVDQLVKVRTPNPQLLTELQGQLGPMHDPHRLIHSASDMLSRMTRMAGVVMLPRRERLTLKQIEFIPMGDRRVLAVLVMNEQEVRNRIFQTDRNWSAQELHDAATRLNERLSGCELKTVRQRLMDELLRDREQLDTGLRAAVDIAQQALVDDAPSEDESLVVSGQTHLMEYGELADMQRLRGLFDAFSQKRDLLGLLDRCIEAQEMQIFIGEESGYDLFGDVSVVTAPYRVDQEVVGVLGVVGPTRMAYDRVIPLVDLTARLLGNALDGGH